MNIMFPLNLNVTATRTSDDGRLRLRNLTHNLGFDFHAIIMNMNDLTSMRLENSTIGRMFVVD